MDDPNDKHIENSIINMFKTENGGTVHVTNNIIREGKSTNLAPDNKIKDANTDLSNENSDQNIKAQENKAYSKKSFITEKGYEFINNSLSKITDDDITATASNSFEGIVGLDDVKLKKIITHDPKMLKVFNEIANIAKTNCSVLILGETGTGKELIANLIHDSSSRKDKGKFIGKNITAITSELIDSTLWGHGKGAFTGAIANQIGWIEEANNGTLFLDEIGCVNHTTQVKLLRYIEEGEITKVGESKAQKVNVRLLFATSVNLINEVQQGKFREDLYYRISPITITLPPLRTRRGDIPLLVRHFISINNDKYGKKISIEDSAIKALMKCKWKGNIRQLKGMIDRISITANSDPMIITMKTLPFEILKDTWDDEDNNTELLIRYLLERASKIVDRKDKLITEAWNIGVKDELIDCHSKYIYAIIDKINLKIDEFAVSFHK